MPSEFQLHPDLASTFALPVDLLYFLLIALSVFFAGGIFIAIFIFCVKYRRRSEDESPKEIHGSLPLELAWSIIPMFMAIGIFTLGADLYFRMYRSPADPIEIYAVGKQWMWKIQHPEGKREINELHVPINKTVRLPMASEDVIHSFFIPAFRVKRDALPGRYTTMWFEATKLGEYHLFCAEFCGTQHSTMIGKVIVMEQEDYQNWLMGGGGSGETLLEAGARQFQQLGCTTCHKSDTSGRGPSLEGIFGTKEKMTSGEDIVVDEDYLRESILNPQAKVLNGFKPVMPTFQGQISEETLIQLIAYIKSLGKTTEE